VEEDHAADELETLVVEERRLAVRDAIFNKDQRPWIGARVEGGPSNIADINETLYQRGLCRTETIAEHRRTGHVTHVLQSGVLEVLPYPQTDRPWEQAEHQGTEANKSDASSFDKFREKADRIERQQLAFLDDDEWEPHCTDDWYYR